MKKMISTVALLAMTGNLLMAGGDIAPVEPVVAQEIVSDDWEFKAGLYGFMPDMGGETASGADIDYPFNDILDDLKMGFMGTFAAQKGKWGFQTDLLYMNVGRKGANDKASIGLQILISTNTGSYRVVESGPWEVDVLGGVSYTYLAGNLNIDPDHHDPLEADGLVNIWNALVGFNGDYNIDESWYIPFFAVIGTGDTDFTWQANTGVGYRTGNWEITALVRYLDYQFDDSDKAGKALNELNSIGPQIGFNYKF